jgi:prephenate dehydratase
MEFDSLMQFEEVMKTIEPVTEQTKIYGVYKNGKTKK